MVHRKMTFNQTSACRVSFSETYIRVYLFASGLSTNLSILGRKLSILLTPKLVQDIMTKLKGIVQLNLHLDLISSSGTCGAQKVSAYLVSRGLVMCHHEYLNEYRSPDNAPLHLHLLFFFLFKSENTVTKFFTFQLICTK